MNAIRGLMILLSGISGLALAGEPAVEALIVEPVEIVLHGSNRQQQVLVTGRLPGGRLVDLTSSCEIASSDSGIASVQGSLVAGRQDGSTTLRVTAGVVSAAVPIRAVNLGRPPDVHFVNDLVPLFSKLGCNNGGCHGKASGQNGFKLSVFGFDPQADYDALAHDGRGRRIFATSPERSLLLTKPSGQVPHGGGKRLEPGSLDYRLLQTWLEAGLPPGRSDAPRVLGLRLSPAERVLGLSATQQLLVTAVFSDGSLRDVTGAAGYTSNALHVAEVERGGRVLTGKVPGEAAITIQYAGHVAVSRIQVPRPGAPQPYPELPAHNRIDELVNARLRTMGILPSDICDDATFLRRVSLDVLGTLPAPAEARAFLADTDPNRRTTLIDRVLTRPEYADYWALQWSDILLVNRDKLGDRGAFQLHRWLREQFAANRPYDAWVRELITASGPSSKLGPVNFYRASATTEDVAKAVSQAFLGIRLECAQCHHHPFEKWSQEDFYGLAGFFNGLQRTATPAGEAVFHTGLKEMTFPGTGRTVPVRAPDGPPLKIAEVTGDPRQRLADWMTRPDNPWFARLVVNRLWKHYLGRGLVEPEDDLRSTNPAANEPLLNHLAASLVERRYDLKAVTRLILSSRTYQLSSLANETNRDDEQNASHAKVKRLPAEVLLDAISAVSESPEAFPGRPAGTRAIELWDNRLPSYFLETFGRSERTSPCECGRSGEPTMAQCLHLMNAPEIEAKLADPTGRVARLIGEGRSDEAIAEELCLAALSRFPAEREKRVARSLFEAEPPTAAGRTQAAQDFLWTLLNSYEFLFVR